MLMLTRTAPLNPRTKEFCARIRSGARPQLMVIQPEPGSEPNYCFFSVRERVRRDGGRIQLGWSIWEWPEVYLEAERHAVFAPADGSPWLDISPALVPEITARLFLPDDAAAEYDFANDGVREDNIREALAADDRIREFFRPRRAEKRTVELSSWLRQNHPGRRECNSFSASSARTIIADVCVGYGIHATERTLFLWKRKEIQEMPRP